MDIDLTMLPLQTFKEIPQPKSDAKSIVALSKKSGKVVGYQLSDGQIYDKPAAINLARQGDIRGVGIATRSGNEYLRSLPDSSGQNNLSSLPIVK